MRNFFTEIDKNKSKSVMIIVGFFVFNILFTYIISLYYGPGSFGGMFITSMLISFATAFGSYFYSDQIILSLSGAHEVIRKDNPEIYNLVENLCLAAGLPTPKIYIIEDTAMNAFATGRDPKHGVVCLTTGIISRLNKQELEGVIAHELAHIGNFDIRLASLVSVMVGTTVLIADWVSHGIFYSSSDDREINPIHIALLLIVLVSAPVVATMIQLSISRNREYLADATAASLTRYPEGLASALEKISGDKEILEAANGATAHLYISNPKKKKKAIVSNLFSTHPPIEERIKRLREM
jgi:heat shock protein HtpX